MQKSFLVFLLIIQVFFVNNTIIAKSQTAIIRQIKAEIEKTDPDANIGVKIRNLQTGQVVYEQNSGRYYTFASSLKFITITAMQQYFGSDYKFINKIIQKNNDYYLEIDDPNFSSEDLNLLILQLKNKEIKNIEGNFYIVNDEFSLPKINVNHMNYDNLYCFGSPLTKVHLDKNCVEITVTAPGKVGDKVKLSQPDNSPYKIINRAIIVSDLEESKIVTSIQGDHYLVQGSFNKKLGKLAAVAVVPDNLKHIALSLKKLLENNNIDLSGKILVSQAQSDVVEVASQYKSFAEVGAIAMKESDNFITDYFLAKFAYDYGAREWNKAGSLLKKYIKQLYGINFDKSSIVDGSGLSRYNLLSVNNFDDYLRLVYQSKSQDKILELMTQPDKNGTLKDRCKNLKLFAKTGTMTGVSSIIGYAFDDKNIPYSFVIVTNNFIGNSKPYKIMEENIIRAVVE